MPSVQRRSSSSATDRSSEGTGEQLRHRGDIRSLPAARGRIPATALTAHVRPEDRVRSLVAGFQVHLAKPVEPGALTAAVAHLAGAESPMQLKVG